MAPTSGKRGRPRPTVYRKRADLPKDLENHMGQANLKFVQKDWDVAIDLCKEVRLEEVKGLGVLIYSFFSEVGIFCFRKEI